MFAAITGTVNAQVSVITHKSTAAESLTRNDAVNIYSLDVSELDGKKIKLFTIQTEGKAREDFFSALGKSSGAIRKIWMQKQLTGNGVAPENVADEDAMLAKVSSTPGSIGYVSTSKVNSSVKVLLVLN